MKKNLKFLKELAKFKLAHLMAFRFNFFAPFFIDGSLFLIQLMVFKSIYNDVDLIGGWKEGEMMIFIGTFSLLNAINMVLYFFGVNNIPDKIKTGEFDLYITKPVNPLLRISFENINPGSIPLVILSICIILYGIQIGGIVVGIEEVFLYCFFILIMVLLYFDMEVIIRSIAFFTISIDHIDKIEEESLELCMNVPGIAFKGIFKIIFYIILPYGIMATLPTECLTGAISRLGIIFGIVIVTVFTYIMQIVWNKGVRHYNSASS